MRYYIKNLPFNFLFACFGIFNLFCSRMCMVKLFGSCLTDIFFKFLLPLMPELRQLKWINLIYIKALWYNMYLNQIVFLLQDLASILLRIVCFTLAFRFSGYIILIYLRYYHKCFCTLNIHVDLIVHKWSSFYTCINFFLLFIKSLLQETQKF